MSNKLYGFIAVGIGACVVAVVTLGSPKAQALPPLKKPVTKSLEAKLQYTSTSPLSDSQKLSFLRDAAEEAGINVPPGLLGPTLLNARTLYVSGRADVTPHCAQTVDPNSNEIIPAPWVKANVGATTPCSLMHKQGLTIRFNVVQPNTPVLVDVWLESTVKSALYYVAPANGGISKPLTLTGPAKGHYMSMFVPKQAGWFAADLRVSYGEVKIKGIQITPAR